MNTDSQLYPMLLCEQQQVFCPPHSKLATALVVFSIVLSIVAYIPFQSILYIWDYQVVEYVLKAINIMRSLDGTILLVLLIAYLRNFSLVNTRKWLVVYAIVCFASSMLFLFWQDSNNITTVIGLVVAISTAIIGFVIGSNLRNFKNDYVGGLNLLGIAFIIYPVATLVSTLFYDVIYITRGDDYSIYSTPIFIGWSLFLRFCCFGAHLFSLGALLNVFSKGQRYHDRLETARRREGRELL